MITSGELANRMEHLQRIGPHAHVWKGIKADQGGAYQVCDQCKARRYTGAQTAAITAWIGGAPLDQGEIAGSLPPKTKAKPKHPLKDEQEDEPHE